MTFRKQVLPSAKREFQRFCDTYGQDVAIEATKWVNDIVASVSRRAAALPTEVSLEELLERLLANDAPPPLIPDSPWVHSWERFRDASWRERARAVLALFRSRRPPWEPRVSKRTFSALAGPDLVELYAYYEVNRADRGVVFVMFAWYSPR